MGSARVIIKAGFNGWLRPSGLSFSKGDVFGQCPQHLHTKKQTNDVPTGLRGASPKGWCPGWFFQVYALWAGSWPALALGGFQGKFRGLRSPLGGGAWLGLTSERGPVGGFENGRRGGGPPPPGRGETQASPPG